MKTINIALGFRESGYIGKPYWPERNTLINIGKDVHPKLGDAKKQQAILAACEKRGIDVAEYARIVEKADYPFYTANGRASEIVIPCRVFQSFLNHASMLAPKAVPRIPQKGLTFVGIKLDAPGLRTGKCEADAKRFERFVKLEESNQRAFSSDLFVEDFQAQGTMRVNEEIIGIGDLLKLVEYGGKWIGIGGARPQGFGRFVVERWDTVG